MSAIGLPRALLYYHYAPMWRALFRALGIEVVVSPPTTRETLALGGARVISEMCMPVKLYCGHVLALVDRVDRVFVPSIHHLHPGTRNCPKLVGLPDLISNVIPEAPLLTFDMEAEIGWPTLSKLAFAVGRHYGINPLPVRKAIEQAQLAQDAYASLLLQGMDRR